MSQTISNDYVSMINKSGSGYNIPEIVDAIVDAAIVPMKEIVTAQKEKVDASISGMATLKSSAQISQDTFNLINGDGHYSLLSSDDQTASIILNDSTKVANFSHEITAVVTAKPMIQIVTGWSGLNHGYGQPALHVSIDGGSPIIVDTDGSDAGQIIEKLNAISGLSAEMIKAAENTYTMVIKGNLGSSFDIDVPSSSGNKMDTSGSHPNKSVIQNASTASFNLDGIPVTRNNNSISDLIEGVTINLVGDNSSSTTTVSASYSATKIKETVEDIIAELNAYKSDLNALGFIDEVGNEDGPLQNSSYLKSAKRQFSKLMTSPIVGFGDKNIYFVDFGIKTAKDGSLVFDQTTFDRTFVNEPEKFDALTKDKVYSDDSQSTPYSVTDAGLPPGKYQYQQSNQKLFSYTSSQAITTTLSGSATDYTRTADGYPGFLIKSNLDNPADYNIYIGHSVKTKLNNFFTDVLASSGQLDATVDLYKDRVSALDARLAKIDQREALLQAQYTKQFSEMEKVVNTSTSSADYVTQLVDGWNKS